MDVKRLPFANYGRGFLMGLAGLFPSVSAGTIALILGIHARLIAALASLDLSLPKDAWMAARGDADARAAMAERDLVFVIVVVLGMATAIFSGVSLVDWLLAQQPGFLMALFVGLMGAGAFAVWRRIPERGTSTYAWALLGTAVAAGTALLPPLLSIGGAFGYVVAGFIAWSFMLLPGVSGSSMMVVLGVYEPLVSAAKNLQWGALFAFALGGVGGIIVCSRFLQWLLAKHTGPAYAVLGGLIAGSIVRVWPWRTEPGFAAGWPAAPEFSGVALFFGMAALAGVLIVQGLERLGPKPVEGHGLGAGVHANE